MVRSYLFPSQKSSAEGRRRSARMAAPGSLGLLQVPPFTAAKCQSVPNRLAARRAPRALFGIRASAADAATKDAVLKAFREKRALKIISGLQNFDRGSVASVITAADKVLLLRPLQQTRFKTGYDCKKHTQTSISL